MLKVTHTNSYDCNSGVTKFSYCLYKVQVWDSSLFLELPRHDISRALTESISRFVRA